MTKRKRGVKKPIVYPVIGTDTRYDVKSAFGSQKNDFEDGYAKLKKVTKKQWKKAFKFANSVL